VIGDALQIVGDEHQVHGAWDGGALFLHERDQFLINGVAQAVHFVISQLKSTLRAALYSYSAAPRRMALARGFSGRCPIAAPSGCPTAHCP
jgi:hypothetical protein